MNEFYSHAVQAMTAASKHQLYLQAEVILAIAKITLTIEKGGEKDSDLVQS